MGCHDCNTTNNCPEEVTCGCKMEIDALCVRFSNSGGLPTLGINSGTRLEDILLSIDNFLNIVNQSIIDIEARLDDLEAGSFQVQEEGIEVLTFSPTDNYIMNFIGAYVTAGASGTDTINVDFTSLDNTITSIMNDITALDVRVTKNEGDISSLDARVTQNETDIDNVETTINNFTNEGTLLVEDENTEISVDAGATPDPETIKTIDFRGLYVDILPYVLGSNEAIVDLSSIEDKIGDPGDPGGGSGVLIVEDNGTPVPFPTLETTKRLDFYSPIDGDVEVTTVATNHRRVDFTGLANKVTDLEGGSTDPFGVNQNWNVVSIGTGGSGYSGVLVRASGENIDDSIVAPSSDWTLNIAASTETLFWRVIGKTYYGYFELDYTYTTPNLNSADAVAGRYFNLLLPVPGGTLGNSYIKQYPFNFPDYSDEQSDQIDVAKLSQYDSVAFDYFRGGYDRPCGSLSLNVGSFASITLTMKISVVLPMHF
jgi:hypothetical protein